MSRIIGVLNYKGGTGKTTTVVNLAAGLALRGERVLCLDMDAQGSLATYLGVEYTYSLTDMLQGQADAQACIVSAQDNLDLIAGDSTILQAEGALWRMDDDQAAWQTLTEKMKDVTGYDYIILDYSPSTSLLSRSGLQYVQEIIAPVSMDYLALVGMRQVLETLKTVAQTSGRHLQLSLIVPTFYYARLRKDREIMKTLQQYFNRKVADPIRANVKLAEAPGHQKDIYEYAPHSYGALDYACLVERVANKRNEMVNGEW